ncbi:transmembrane protein 268 [Bufo gargarizans]|uniref:transmembrane protein 268 n=1 Tax=Bufo gargarizans TaxID=30331 RepID=UPI001CF2120E|nr:transmembrane protein 268 [Bufo gargarizans]XP_044162043.1 transmembrane protein 268 [Bufo gargarizans]
MTGTDGDEGPRIDGPEPVVTLHSGLYNGRLLMVLPYTSRAEQAEQCLRRLQDCGIQVPVEHCKDSLQIPALIPEVYRYIFFSSRGFVIILAVVLYASIWINLYSTAQMFSSGPSWLTSIPVTITAAIVTVVVIFSINNHQKKINVNTDIRLAAANEVFMEYNVLLGISDRSRSCHSAPSLCFIYFHLWGCHQKLSQRLANMSKDDLGKFLHQQYIFIETPADPAWAQARHEDNTTEESPLLASASRHKPVLCNTKIPLIPQGHPEVMARQLLIIASACYVRLLTSGKLPRSHAAGHTGVLDVPCPCQFIESSILTAGHCFTCM